MSLAQVETRALVGLTAPPVQVEVHVSGGLPAFNVVGLPEAAVKESRDRVRSAIINSSFEFPAQRITVNLAPADLPKEGGRFDLAIALGILAATGQVPADALANMVFLGELALDGRLRPVRGVLPVAVSLQSSRYRLLVPTANASEAALVDQLEVFHADNLLAVTAGLHARDKLVTALAELSMNESLVPDMRDVHGQFRARRALEIAAAGGHSILFVGPPGAGKSLLSARMPGILPPMNLQECLEVAAIASISHQGFSADSWGVRPYRAPHHTASAVALVGGGSLPRPGEITLAHKGVLFLDELPEFSRQVLEVLREPMESGRIHISRAARQAEFPAEFQLVAAMNPCPCGYHGDPRGSCRCTEDQVQRYQEKISGPLLDRIDLRIDVPRLPARELTRTVAGEASSEVRARVVAARERQLQRQGSCNARLPGNRILQDAMLEPAALAMLEQAAERFGFSARGFHRIARVARTIADLAGSERITVEQLGEAVAYRQVQN